MVLLLLNVEHLVDQVSQVVRQATPFDLFITVVQKFYCTLVMQIIVVSKLKLVVANDFNIKIGRLEGWYLRIVKVELACYLCEFRIVAVSDHILLSLTFDAQLAKKVWIEDKLVCRLIVRDGGHSHQLRWLSHVHLVYFIAV